MSISYEISWGIQIWTLILFPKLDRNEIFAEYLRIFTIKNGYIVFHSILQHDLCAQTTCLNIFALWLRQLRNMVFERFNSIFWRRKSLTTLDMLEQKEVIGCQVTAVRRMTHQFSVLAARASLVKTFWVLNKIFEIFRFP